MLFKRPDCPGVALPAWGLVRGSRAHLKLLSGVGGRVVAVPFAEAGDEAGKPGPRGKHVCVLGPPCGATDRVA